MLLNPIQPIADAEIGRAPRRSSRVAARSRRGSGGRTLASANSVQQVPAAIEPKIKDSPPVPANAKAREVPARQRAEVNSISLKRRKRRRRPSIADGTAPRA